MRGLRACVAAGLVVVGVQVLTSPVEAGPVVATASDQRVYVAVISGHGEQSMSTEQINDAVDAGLDDIVDQVPNVVSSFTRVETREFGSPVTPTGDAMCGVWAPNSLIATPLPPGTWEAMQAEGRALFGLPTQSPDTHVVYVLPPRCAANAIGSATLGTDLHSGGFLVVSAGWEAGLRGVVVHELGHNFGLGHANATCFHQGASCGVIDYGDCYAPMGGNIGSVFSTAERVLLGAVQPGEVQTVDAGSTAYATQIRLYPRSAGSGLRGVAVTDPSSGEVTYLDYRSHTGLDSDAEYGSSSACPMGVTATRIQPGASTLLLRRGEPAIGAADTGETFPIGDYASATVLSADGDAGALLNVRVTPPPAFDQTPRVTVARKHGRWVAARLTGRFRPEPQRVSYTWHVQDASGSHLLGPTAKDSSPGPVTWVPPTVTRVWVEVTAYRKGRTRATVTSRHTSMAASGPTGAVRLRGTPRVGRSLKVQLPDDVHGPVFYRWFADQRRIKGADRARLGLTPELAGTLIRVVVVSGRGDDRQRTVCRAKTRVKAANQRNTTSAPSR